MTIKFITLIHIMCLHSSDINLCKISTNNCIKAEMKMAWAKEYIYENRKARVFLNCTRFLPKD